MKGFGSDNNGVRQQIQKKLRLYKDKLMSNVLTLHSSGKIMLSIFKAQLNILINEKNYFKY